MSQPPQLLFARAWLKLLEGRELKPASRNALDKKSLHEFERTASMVESPPWSMHHAAKYLRALCEHNVNKTHGSPPTLKFNNCPGRVKPDFVIPDTWMFKPPVPRLVEASAPPPPPAKAKGMAAAKAAVKGKGKGKGKGKKGKGKAKAPPPPPPPVTPAVSSAAPAAPAVPAAATAALPVLPVFGKSV